MGALVDKCFSQISTSFIFEDLSLRNLPILHLKNYLKDSDYLGILITTTLKILHQHHIGGEYARSRQVFTRPRSNLIVHGIIMKIKGWVYLSTVDRP